MKPLISICIPAYRRCDIVKKTIESIYSQNIDFNEFEVIVSENDNDKQLESLMKVFVEKYPNFSYHFSNCEGFMNSYYSMTYAKGDLIKLHNSQSIWLKGSLKKTIDIVKQYREEKPLIYFSDGRRMNFNIQKFESFDSFMYELSYFSSWSNGFSIWREDFEINKNIDLNHYFPHTSLFLSQYNKKKFIIDDRVLYGYQKVPKKGGHNMFESFSVDYTGLIENEKLLGHITKNTCNHIKRGVVYDFLPTLFYLVFVAKKDTYDSSNFRTNLKKYYPSYCYYLVPILSILCPFKKLYLKYARNGKV